MLHQLTIPPQWRHPTAPILAQLESYAAPVVPWSERERGLRNAELAMRSDRSKAQMSGCTLNGIQLRLQKFVRILSVMKEAGGEATRRHICDTIGVSTSNVSVGMVIMNDLGLIENCRIVPNKSTKAVKIERITEKGYAFIEEYRHLLK